MTTMMIATHRRRPAPGPPVGRSGRADVADRPVRPARSTPATRAVTTPRELKARIDRIDDRERRFGYAAALGSVFFGVMLYVVDTHDKHFRVAKGQFTPQTALIVSLVAAVLLVAATRFGKRSLFAFVAFLTGPLVRPVLPGPRTAVSGPRWLVLLPVVQDPEGGLGRGPGVRAQARDRPAATRSPRSSRGMRPPRRPPADRSDPRPTSATPRSARPPPRPSRPAKERRAAAEE